MGNKTAEEQNNEQSILIIELIKKFINERGD